MGINKNGTLSYKVNFNVGRSYFISELAYHTFCKRIDAFNLSDIDVLTIILTSLMRYGNSGWRGATDTEQSMGDQDVMEEYNEYYARAESWMSEYLPTIKDK